MDLDGLRHGGDTRHFEASGRLSRIRGHLAGGVVEKLMRKSTRSFAMMAQTEMRLIG